MPLLRSSLIATTCLFAVSAHAGPCGTEFESQHPPLYPLPDEERWGYVGADGEWRLAPQWRQVRPFSEGRAAVETKEGWGLIGPSGAYVVPPGPRDADAVIIDETRYHLSPYKPFSEGCSAATPEEGSPHFITPDGTRWDPPAFTEHDILDIGAFSEGLAWVRVDNKDDSETGWIDSDGSWAIEPEYHDGGDFAAGRAPAAMSDTNWGYIDRNGALVFPSKFVLSESGPYADGLAPVKLGDDIGYMDADDWAIRKISFADGTSKAMAAAGPFADGLAPVREAQAYNPAPVWINQEGEVVIDPESDSRLTICNKSRLPRYHDGLLPLVVGDGTNLCGNTPEVSHEGLGDTRSGPQQMLWALPWARDKLVWLDRDGHEVIDSSACRRPAGMEPLSVEAYAGVLAAGAYRMEVSGAAEGQFGPVRADAPCNRSEYTLADNEGTNDGGPWRFSLRGEARWQGHPVNTNLSLNLPEGLSAGTHEVGAFDDDTAVNGLLWLSLQQSRASDSERPATYRSQGGTLTLSKFDQASATGHMEVTLAPRDAPERTINLSARFREIPYTFAPEIEITQLSGALAELQEEMPDDPLVNFFTPIEVTEADGRLYVVFGTRGPNLELVFPAGHYGPFTAGPDEPVSASLSEMPVSAEGTLSRADGVIAGDVAVEIRNHPRFDGGAGMSLRFAHVPLATSSDE
ncbi:WG containing repeat-containing protein [Halomonas daqiaonensis]|uniref:WG containing repeat-containing protein n=1 Tax=Halomonas daqiaonensis TaxID=650850 RepID=A0A1H7FKP7_9GAMM|nr:WG repeat-containing protein [Halomonas daqiaonensis]SEK26538.1 WG containing repeat-containing protein [Halomonas daqiaonensis]